MAEIVYDSFNQVIGDKGSQIGAETLVVQAEQQFDRFDRDADADVASPLGSEDADRRGEFKARRDIIWDGNVSLFAGPNAVLEIDANHRIIKAQNVTTNDGLGADEIINSPIISVDSITGANAGSALFQANDIDLSHVKLRKGREQSPVSSVSGSQGQISGASAFERVDIRSESEKPLEINGIDVANPDSAPSVELFADDVTLTFDVGHEMAPSRVRITNTQSNTTLNDLINNPLGNTRIVSERGSIWNSSGSIRSNQVELFAAQDFGSLSDRLVVELVRAGDATTDLRGEAGNDIYLDVLGRLRDENEDNAVFNTSTLVAGDTADLQLHTAVQETTPLGGSVNGVNVKVTKEDDMFRPFFVHFRPDGDISDQLGLDPIYFADTNFAEKIESLYEIGLIEAADISMNASQPGTDQTLVHLTANTNILGDGNVQTKTNGVVDLTEIEGDLRIDRIQSTASDVALATTGFQGTIFAVAQEDGDTPSVMGNSISLDASGGIGHATNFLAVNSSDFASGMVRAEAIEEVFLTETQGDLYLDRVVSKFADVALRTIDAGASILGGGAVLNFTNGNILIRPDGQTMDSGQVTIKFVADADVERGSERAEFDSGDRRLVIHVNDDSDTTLGAIAAAINGLDGFQAVVVDGGQIFQMEQGLEQTASTRPRRSDVQGRQIDLVSDLGTIGEPNRFIEIYGAGVGQQMNSREIDTQVPDSGRLYAVSHGGLYIQENNAALRVLKAESATADVQLHVLDTAFLNAQFEGPYGEDLIIQTEPGATLTGLPIAAGIAAAANGSIILDVGDDVYIPAGATATAGTEIIIRGDFGGARMENPRDPDEFNGTTMELSGSITAPIVRAMGGNDIDFLQIWGTTGMNPNGETYLIGNGADDHFFVQSTAGTTTLQGGAGADRFHVSSNASKQGATTNGFYKGTLDYILSPLMIHTGEQGNGGTRDIIRISAGGSTTSVHGQIDNNSVTGLGLPSRIDFSAPDAAFVKVGLSQFDDTFQVRSVANNIIAEVHGRDGNDTVEVRNDEGLDNLRGIFSFLGNEGDSDTLNVYGDATAAADLVDPDQITAIGITGLGMSLEANRLFSTHETQGANYDPPIGLDSVYPAVIYFAKRETVDGQDQFTSSTEIVNVLLAGGDDTIVVDSTNDQTTVNVQGGLGDDTMTVSSTPTGLYPGNRGRVDFIHGELNLFGGEGENTIIMDDSGDNNPNVGTYEGVTVTGLDMPGSVSFDTAEQIEVRLGNGGNTFYVPGTGDSVVTTLKTGDDFDTVYVGTREGYEDSGSLDNFLGNFIIEGGGPEARDSLFFNDQDHLESRTFHIDNQQTSQITLETGEVWPVDTTTVQFNSDAAIEYRQMETVGLNAGQGSDVVNLMATHREQSPTGGLNSTFTVNGGAGDDQVLLGKPDDAGHRLDSFSIHAGGLENPPTATDPRGIPVMINGQQGDDTLHFQDTATDLATNVAFATRHFDAEIDSDVSKIFPSENDSEFFDLFTDIFGEDPRYDDVENQIPTAYATVVLDRDTRDGEHEPEPGLAALNVNARTTETIEVSLGSGDDVVQLTSGEYSHNLVVNAGGGNDLFNVEDGVDMLGHTATVNGEAGDDTVFVDFEPGVPIDKVSLTFNGGSNSNGLGDKFRIAGDGLTAGGQYHPESSADQSGSLTIGGNEFSFTGVEPLVVHGLPDFQVVGPDEKTDQRLDTVRVEDLELTNLSLKVVTVDGVVSWPLQHQFCTNDAPESCVADGLEPQHLGKVMSMSGNTLAVAADLNGASHGAVYVYNWTGSSWQEKAKLYPGDRLTQGRGEDFGASVALVGDRLYVGAPGDDERGIDAGAVYVFERDNGVWGQMQKLMSPGTGAAFGTSVAADESSLIVGAPGDNLGVGWAYAFNNNLGTVNVFTATGVGFGHSVAVAGNHFAIGIPLDDQYGADVGAVQVYRQTNGLWTEQAKLGPSEPDAGEQFGWSLAMADNRIVVGAPGWDGLDDTAHDQGRAFVFDFEGGRWIREARLTADAGLPENEASGEGPQFDQFENGRRLGDRFGASVAADGNYVVVGRPGFNSTAQDSGAAYVFYELPDSGSGNGPTWTRSSGPSGSGRLLPSNPAGSDPDALLPDHFAASVAISGTRIAVGRPGFNDTVSLHQIPSASTNVSVKPGDWVQLTSDVANGIAHEVYKYVGGNATISINSIDFTSQVWESIDVIRTDAPLDTVIANGDIVLDVIGNSRLDTGKLYKFVGQRSELLELLRFPSQSFLDDFVPLNATIVRGDVGAFQSFDTNGAVPGFSSSPPEEIWAEKIADPLPELPSQFGSVTHYDPESRTLFVGDPGQNKVYTYVNEGLYWRGPVLQSDLYITDEGLRAEYFEPSDTVDDFDFSNGFKGERTEYSINRPNSRRSFVPAGAETFSVREDHFTVRWTGEIYAVNEDDFTFFLGSDDGSKLYIDDELVVDNGGPHGWLEKNGTKRLTRGAHEIRVEYFEQAVDNGIKLEYFSSRNPSRRLLTDPVHLIESPDEIYITADGLSVKYYESQEPLEDFDFNQEFKTLPDWATKDFAIHKPLTRGSFAPGLQVDNFSVRWTGEIHVEQEGYFNFFLKSDDGSRLYIDDMQVIDHGGLHAFSEKVSSPIFLTRGTHKIKVEYFEAGVDAGIKLEYQPLGEETRRLLTGPMGKDIDVDGDWMVVGAPDSKALAFRRNGDGSAESTWAFAQELEGAGAFGAAVAVDGNQIVVGMPEAQANYHSDQQYNPDYRLNLGVTGGAVVFAESGGSFSYDHLLMPDDDELPLKTSELLTNISIPADWNQVTLTDRDDRTHTVGIGLSRYDEIDSSFGGKITSVDLAPYTVLVAVDPDNTGDDGYVWISNNTGDEWNEVTLSDIKEGTVPDASLVNSTIFPPIEGRFYGKAGDKPTDLDFDWFMVGTTQRASEAFLVFDDNAEPGSVQVACGPSDELDCRRYSGGAFASSNGDGIGVYALPDNQILIADIGSDGGVAWTNGFNDDLAFLGRDNQNELDGIFVASSWVAELVEEEEDLREFEDLDSALWGSSVDIVGNSVFVGAPGIDRVATYDLGNGGFVEWNATIGGFNSDAPHRTGGTYDGGETFGNEVEAVNSSKFLVGDGIAGHLNSIDAPIIARIISPDNSFDGEFGARHAIDSLGSRSLIGSPGARDGAGMAYLFDSNDNYTGRSFVPFIFDTTTSPHRLAPQTDPNIQFGAGGALISEQHQVIGTNNSNEITNQLYNFRPRGPLWLPTKDTGTITPAPLPTPKLGSDVSIYEDTAVLGMQDYDGRGAVWVLTTVANSDNWQHQQLIQVNDLNLGDDFGAQVAVFEDTLIVGATSQNSAYLFRRSGSKWIQQDKYSGGVGFASSIDIGRDKFVIGSPVESKIYVYERIGSQWNPREITGDLPGFGTSVAIDGDTIAASAPSKNIEDSSFVRVYSKTNKAWTPVADLKSFNIETPGFGASLGLSGDHLIVGAAGEVFAYQIDSSGVWTKEQSLLKPASATDAFGSAIALDGAHLVIGDHGQNQNTGAAYTYGFRNGKWQLETVVDSLPVPDAFFGDQVGFAVDISQGTAILGAPQFEGRLGSAIDTLGNGYSFLRDVSAPVNVVAIESQEDLINGAQANVLGGSVNGVPTVDFTFFDIPNISIDLGDLEDELLIPEAGLSAYGLSELEVNLGGGDDQIIIESTNLTPPAVDRFVPVGDFENAQQGDPLPERAEYVRISGGFSVQGGDATDTITVRGNVDWTLNTDSLATDDDVLAISELENAVITGGRGNNRIEAESWPGTVYLNGAEGEDELTVHLATVLDSRAVGEQLNILGSEDEEEFVVHATTVLSESNRVNYQGSQSIELMAGAGDDHIIVVDSGASRVFLDGEFGSDDYTIVNPTITGRIDISDSGPTPEENGDIDTLFTAPNPLRERGVDFPVGGKTVHYDETIEEAKDSETDTTVDSQGSMNPDLIVLHGTTLTIADTTPLEYAFVVDSLTSSKQNYQQLLQRLSPQNIKTVDLSQRTEVQVDSLGGDDIFVVIDVLPSLQIVEFEGNQGSEIFFGPDQFAEWLITGEDEGTLTETTPGMVDFTSIENFVGGMQQDRFAFASEAASVTGDIRGSDGRDTLDYSALSSSLLINLSTQQTPQIGGHRFGIENYIGTSQADSFVGANMPNQWQITGLNQGSVGPEVTFSSFENITGGRVSDTFHLFSLGNIDGLINGANGSNELVLQMTDAVDNVVINAGQVHRNGTLTSYQNIQAITVHAEGNDDVVDVNVSAVHFPVIVHVEGGHGNDLVNVVGTTTGEVYDVTDLSVEVDDTKITLNDLEDLSIFTNDGDDQVLLAGINVSGTTQISGEGGNDSIHLAYPILTGEIIVNGGIENDSLFITTPPNSVDNAWLTANTFQLTRHPTANYAEFELLDIQTGAGNDKLTVESTHFEATSILTGDGDDLVSLRTTSGHVSVDTQLGDDHINVGSLAPAFGGMLDGITMLTVRGSDGLDVLNIDDTGDGKSNTGALTATTLTGFGIAERIDYEEMESLEVSLGSGPDSVSIQGTMRREDSFRTVTVVNAGPGNDIIDAELSNASDGFMAINAENGDDLVDASSSTLPLVIFGGVGADRIDGSAGDNIIFGDRGIVDYRDQRGNLITRLGVGASVRPPGDTAVAGTFLDVPARQTDGVAYHPTLAVSQDATLGGNDTIISTNGDDLIFGGSGDDQIDASGTMSDRDLVVGDNGKADFYPSGTIRYLGQVTAIEGGDDTISTGAGQDAIIGGAANDRINAAGELDDADVVIGDNGAITFDDASSIVHVTTSHSDVAGTDTITTGNGQDVVFGGSGDDFIDTSGDDQSADFVAGDSGVAQFESGRLRDFASEPDLPQFDGGDDIITGGGSDLILGGGGNDNIVAGDTAVTDISDADVVLGDHGFITFTNGAISQAETSDFDHGGNDTIAVGPGRDVVFGGTGNDNIDARFPDDVGSTTGATGRVISFNFGSILPDAHVTGTAGAVPVGNWNNVPLGQPVLIGHELGDVLFDDGSHADGVTLSLGRDLGVGNSGPLAVDSHDQIYPVSELAQNQDDRLFEGYLFTDPLKTLGIDLAGLSVFGDAGYDVYVYLDADNSNSASRSVRSISDGTTTFYLDDPQGNSFNGRFVEVTAEDSVKPGLGNYVVFRGVMGDTFQLRIEAAERLLDDENWNGPALSALQIVDAATNPPSTRANDGNILIGDNGKANFANGQVLEVVSTEHRFEFGSIEYNDVIEGSEDFEVIIGGNEEDYLSGNAGNDLIFGDNARVSMTSSDPRQPIEVASFELLSCDIGGPDSLNGGAGNDSMYGQYGDDTFLFVGLGLGRDQLFEDGQGIECANDDRDLLDFSEFGAPVHIDLADIRQQRVSAADLDIVLSSDVAFEDVIGGPFDDLILGNDRMNQLEGRAGDDIIRGLVGDDLLLGGSDDDRIFGGVGDDTIQGDAGDDDLLGEDGDDSILGGSGEDVIKGGQGNDFLEGNEGADTINAEAGDDMVFGGSDADVVTGGPGDDQIHGGPGADHLHGNDGNDELHGDTGNDQIFGEAGNDTIHGNADHDIIDGGPDADWLFGNGGQDIVAGRGGRDYIEGNAGNDWLAGGAGPDIVFGGMGDDELFGNEGDDSLSGEDGHDRIYGGIGADIALGGTGNDTIHGQDGSDTLIGEDGNDLVSGDAGHDIIRGGDGDDELEGNEGHDRILGDAGDDIVRGGAGDDEITGGSGNDRIDGGTEDDMLSGNDGDDVIFGRSGRDTIRGGSGSDEIDGGSDNDVLNGDAGPDIVNGGDGDDVIDGGSGDDVLDGEAGDDVIDGDEGEDEIHGGGGNDLIRGGDDNDSIRGGDGDDKILGEVGADTIEGGIGRDELIGGDGDDRLSGNQGADIILGGPGNDEIRGHSGDDDIDGQSGNDTIWGNGGNDTIEGGPGDDRIEGNHGDDVIRDNAGDDIITAAPGHDIVVDLPVEAADSAIPENSFATSVSLGDINADGKVGFADFLVLATNFNKRNASRSDGDLDEDGTVSFADFLIFSANMTKELQSEKDGKRRDY